MRPTGGIPNVKHLISVIGVMAVLVTGSAVTSAVNMIVNPVETVEGLPGGVSRLFGRIELGAEQVAAAATAPSQSGEQQVASVSERVGTITVDALGYEKERRQLAKSLGVDP